VKDASAECAGGTGEDTKLHMDYGFASEFSFPHIKVLYPTAPFR